MSASASGWSRSLWSFRALAFAGSAREAINTVASALPMRTLEIFHLRRVRDKPRAVQALVEHAGLNADAALAVVHQAVGGGKPRVNVTHGSAPHESPDDVARRLIHALADTGFIARRASDDDFDPGQQAQEALAAVVPRCAPDLADAVGALLLDGGWPQALALALQHLQMHRPSDDADRRQLEHTAVDTGLVRGVPGRV